MRRQRGSWRLAVGFMTMCWLGSVSLSMSTVRAQNGRKHLGGAHGSVRNAGGQALEGIGVQLISPKTAIRTTVYTNEEGRYEFPVLEPGTYTLRTARPMEYKPYMKESLHISGSTQLEDIALSRVSETEFLPPTPEILAQLTGTEWMLNIPGTGEEKRVFSLTCGFGCHSYQQIFRARYDEAGWRLILQRMMRGSGSPLINMAQPTPQNRDRAGRPTLEDEELLTKWFARVRGPEAKDPPSLSYLPRERGAATRVVVTEYELPRQLLAPHDVHGDSKGNIWYTAHRSPYSGVLDPRTGQVKEYRIPEKEKDTVGALPGTHRVWVDKNDIVWFSEQWDHYLTALDPKLGKTTKRWKFPTLGRLNSSGMGNFAMDDNGFAYIARGGEGVIKINSATGEIVRKYPFKKIRDTYDSIITPDGRYWSGCPIGSNLIGLLDTVTGEMWEAETGVAISSGSRGGFDGEGNPWFGGRGGALIKLDHKTKRVTEYYPPYAYETFYEAMPDKNGEIWAGGLHSGRFIRFNPKTEQWVAYMMPEPYSHDHRTWIDNSTSPVTVWYVDHNGYMVRIQPLE